MADKQLKDKAVNIKGKSYVLVADRVVYFNEQYPTGSISTSYSLDGNTYHFRAEVRPDATQPSRVFSGHSQATIGDGMVNKTAACENAETSAVGRALAMMGIGVIESIASVDEINKAQGSAGAPRRATMKQIQLLAQKVKWANPGFNREETIQYIEGTIGKTLDKLMAGDMDEALQKIDTAIREDKIMDKLADKPVEPEVGDLPEGEINIDDNIPY